MGEIKDIIINAVIFATISSIYLAAGFRVMTAKTPLLVGQRLHILFVMIPSMAIVIYEVWPKYTGQSRLPFIIVIACMTMVCGINLWQFRGGIVIGASEALLNDALRHSLNRLSLPYEESAQAFRLPTLNNVLVAGTTVFDGIFILRLKKFKSGRVIGRLAVEIKDFFRTAPVRINRRLSYSLVVIGAALLIFGSWFTYEQLSFRAKMRAMRDASTERFK